MNKAKLIEFNPKLLSTDVTIPADLCLVIANSLTPSPKLLTLGTRYNKRVVECRFALAILALKTGLVASSRELLDFKYKNFYELQMALNASFEKMVADTNTHLKKGGYNKEEITKEIGLPNIIELIKDVPYGSEVLE
jgi:galactokinase